MKKPVRMAAATVVAAFVVLLGFIVLAGRAEPVQPLGYEEMLDRGLRRVLELCAGLPRARVELGTNLALAREDLIERVPVQTLTSMVDALAEAGADHIEISMGMFPWREEAQETIAKYDAVAKRIRQSNVALVLSLEYSTAYHTCSSFAEWREWAAGACPRIAERYRPETFVVLNRPSLLAGQFGGELDPAAWGALVEEVAAAIRAASPGTRCAVSILTEREQAFNRCLAMEGLDSIALHTCMLRDLRPAARLAAAAREQGLDSRLAGNWRPPAGVPYDAEELARGQWMGKSIGDAALAPMDARWIEAVALAAGVLDIGRVTFLWTPAFFAYAEDGGDTSDPQYLQRVFEAVNAGERTAAYRAFEDAARDYGSSTAPPKADE